VGGLLHLVQGGQAWARAGAPPSPLLAVPHVTAHAPINGQCSNRCIDGPLLCGFNVAIKGLSPRRKAVHAMAMFFGLFVCRLVMTAGHIAWAVQVSLICYVLDIGA